VSCTNSPWRLSRSDALPALEGAPRPGAPALIHSAFRRLPPPLVLIGMHGSGTSIVSRILGSLGAYMGHHLDEHAEAGEFFALNEEILYRAGASWDRVDPLLNRIDDARFARSSVRRLRLATLGSLRTGYLRNAPADAAAWGWKDPRNSLTLPFWLRLFPTAKVIHIHRDLEDAAKSIRRRANQWAESPSEGPAATPEPWVRRAARLATDPTAIGRFLRRRARAGEQGDPCLDLDYCRTLARSYHEACSRWRGEGSALMVLRYEDLLGDPIRATRALAEFAGLKAEAAAIANAASLVRPRTRVLEPART
jgi:hypothetical protein